MRVRTLMNLWHVWMVALVASAATVHGRVDNVPDDIVEYHQLRNIVVANDANYPSRISLELFEIGKPEPSLVPVFGDYSFTIEDLKPGNYSMLVNSYDFALSQARLRIDVDEDDSVEVYPDDYVFGTNITAAVAGTPEDPVVLSVISVKNFYETPKGSLMGLIMNSPLGPVFKNKWLLGIFIASLSMLLAPKLLEIFAPEVAKSIKEAQEEVNRERQQEREAKLARKAQQAKK